MQYLMTKDELDAMVPKSALAERDTALAEARTKILVLSGFSCVHDEDGPNSYGYCDECPCSAAANEWRREWDHICNLHKRYSK